MAASRLYLDCNAGAPLLAVARQAAVDALDTVGNASSVHVEGRAQRAIVDRARRQVASLVNGEAERVIFTSGATEAASMLLSPRWLMGRSPLPIGNAYVGSTEHPCVHGGGHFPTDRVRYLPVNADGLIDLGSLAAALARDDGSGGLPLVAIQAANGETGVVQPVGAIAEITRAAKAILVVDAVQMAGRLPLDMDGADFMILSSHKIGGPKGAGAIVAAGDVVWPEPLLRGGGQESGHRAGTENVPAIAGFGAAAEAAIAALERRTEVEALRDGFERFLDDLAAGIVVHGRAAPRLPNTSYFSVPGVKAETLQIAMDLAGIAVSSGSACSSGKVGPSHVLEAMEAERSAGALRVSIGTDTSTEDIGRLEAELAAFLSRAERRRAKVA